VNHPTVQHWVRGTLHYDDPRTTTNTQVPAKTFNISTNF